MISISNYALTLDGANKNTSTQTGQQSFFGFLLSLRLCNKDYCGCHEHDDTGNVP